MPPAVAISRLSVSICRMIRPRPAPSAALIAASRPRAAARASSRLAVFTQAIRSSNPTAASITIKDDRTPLARLSCSPTNPVGSSLGRMMFGNAAPSARQIDSASLDACSAETPARSRPTTA